MTERAARKLDFSRKLLLSALGLMAVGSPVVFGLLHATQSRAGSQAQNSDNASVFEVASIKLNKSGNQIVAIRFGPDGLTATNFTLRGLIRTAYGVDDEQILGGSSWINSEKYDLEAKVDSAVVDDLRKLSPDQRNLEQRRRLQALLADRFKLTLHRDTRELPVYVLVLAKNGPKVQEAKPGDTYSNGPTRSTGLWYPERGKLIGQGVSMAALVRSLSNKLGGRKVLDKTGLMGNHDFTLQWTPEEIQAPTGGQQGTDNTPLPDSSGFDLYSDSRTAGVETGIAKRPRGGSRHRSCREAFGKLAAGGVPDIVGAD